VLLDESRYSQMLDSGVRLSRSGLVRSWIRTPTSNGWGTRRDYTLKRQVLTPKFVSAKQALLIWVRFDRTRFHPIELDTQIYQFALSEKKDPFEPKGLPWTDFLVLAERVLALKDNIFDESWIEYLLAQHRLRSSFEMFQQGTGAAGAVKEA